MIRGVYQLVQGPTRHWPNQPSTGLDHFFSNRPDKISSVYTQVWGGSDHMLVSGIRVSRSIISTPSYIRKRCYKSFNQSDFLAAIEKVSWMEIYLCNNVNEAVRILSEKIRFILDAMAPMRSIQIRKKIQSMAFRKNKRFNA